MKLIDIFNKIANDEPVPKKVKFNDEIYTYKPEWKDYADEDEHYGLFVDTISNTYQITKMLNEEIEIIEEDKKIEKLDLRGYYDKDIQNNSEWVTSEEILALKINELINEVNKLKGDKNE
jgi:hypothetical protein